MSKNVVLTNADDEQILPITTAENVYVSKRKTLIEALADKADKKDIEDLIIGEIPSDYMESIISQEVTAYVNKMNMAEASNVSFAQAVQEIQGDNLCFLLQSDTHYKHDDETNRADIISIANLTNYINCDFIGHLGDSISASKLDDYNASLNDLSHLMYDYTQNKNPNTPLLMTKGDRDDGSLFVYTSNSDNGTGYGLDHLITNDKLFAKEFNQMGAVPVYPENVDNPMYYYVDIKDYRIIVLNSIDVIISESNGKLDYYGGSNSNCYGYAQDQLNWFANVALKTNKKILVFTHIPLSLTISNVIGRNSGIVLGILDAFVNGESYQGVNSATPVAYANFKCDVSVDFSSQGPGTVVGVWSGHTHSEQRIDRDVENGVLYPHINIKSGCENGKIYVIKEDTIVEIDVSDKETTREFDY